MSRTSCIVLAIVHFAISIQVSVTPRQHLGYLDTSPIIEAPPEAKVSVRNITYGGTGCPQGSAVTDPTGSFFPAYRAEIGPQVPIAENRKTCTINVDILYEKNWQFRIRARDENQSGVKVRLDNGVKATYRSAYYFSGDSINQKVIQYDFIGPYNRVSWVADPPDGFETVFSPCGVEGMLNIARQIRLAGVGGTGSIEYFDSDVNQAIQWESFEWRKC